MSSRIEALRRRVPWPTLVVGFAAGLAGVVGSYAAVGVTPGFVVAPVEAALSRTVPGVLLTVAITVLGDLGQQLNLAFATFLSVVVLGGLAAGARRLAPPGSAGVAIATTTTALVVGIVSVVVTRAPLSAVGAGAGAAAVVAPSALPDAIVSRRGEPADASGRRSVLAGLAGLAGVGLVGTGIRRLRGPPPTDDEDGPPPGSEAAGLLDEADRKSLDVSGIEPLVSENFYTVDINAVDPTVAREDWSLSVTGAVDEAFTIDFDDLTARESREEFVTLRCVGEQLNGKKMDTALWTVVDVRPILEAASVPDECCVMVRAADGYFEEFPLDALENATLAYRMNGRPLPRAHGAPVRLHVPGHWGEINVKWVDEIEILSEPADGYWEQRGWHGTGPVTPVAKLHAVNRLDDGRIEVGGHAYAGTRGVSRVAVSTDGGSSWVDATLSEPLPGADVWRQWVHRYEPPGGEHEVVVRMYDDEGVVQPESETGPFPSGPSGWVRETVEP